MDGREAAHYLREIAEYGNAEDTVSGLVIDGMTGDGLRVMAPWLRHLAELCEVEADRHRYEQAQAQEFGEGAS
jgi:hypothetical protein